MSTFTKISFKKWHLCAIAAANTTVIGTNRKSTHKGRYYTINEVQKFDGRNGNPIFVTFRGGVYDGTTFAKEHPGGNLIEQAAGGDVETFWKKWAYHYHSNKVVETLKELRVGTLIGLDNAPLHSKRFQYKENDKEEDLYQEDPKRTNEHKILMEKPFASETRIEFLNSSYLTPTSALYVRNHSPVPTFLDFTSHEICFTRETNNVEEEDEDTILNLSLQDILQKYKSINVISVLQCAGNRASESIKTNGANGFVGTPFEDIQIGMVGNILWNGVPLQNVLQDIFPNECKEQQENMKDDTWHVIFEGADEYETSVPLSYVLEDGSFCVLATKMNNENLSKDHGYPVRVVLPGIAGARSVKWLQSIKLSKQASKSPWNTYYYRTKDGSHIQKLPLNSLILLPKSGEAVKKDNEGMIDIDGVAYCGGSGKRIMKVEISPDNGESWVEPTLSFKEINQINDFPTEPYYGWVRFHTRIEIPQKCKNINTQISSSPQISSNIFSLVVRATDEDGDMQPKISKKERGYLYNGWHKVEFTTS